MIKSSATCFASRSGISDAYAVACRQWTDKTAKPAASTAPSGDIDDLKRQIDEMQKRIDRIGDKDK